MTHPAFRDGRVAVVTGAAMGIGRAMVEAFAARGMRVALLDTAPELQETAAETGGLALPCDVSDLAQVEAARDAVLAQLGPPTVLVNNAASRAGRGWDAPLSAWQQAIDVNILGVIHGIRAFQPVMEPPGAIISVGSKQGITNPPGHPVYNLTKAAVKSLTEGLEHELRQSPDPRLTAHLLIPGWTTSGNAEHKEGAWHPHQVVEHMMAALDRGDFYILCPDGEVTAEMDAERIRIAAEDVIAGHTALSRWA